MEKTGGIILCGGKSSRMGFDKANLRFGPESMLERVMARARQVAGHLVVSLAARAEPPPLPPDVTVAFDRQLEKGPLWGLAEGFRSLSGKAERVVIIPVDMPFFTPRWMTKLVDELEENQACLYRWEGYPNALAAAYNMDLLPKLEKLIAGGCRRPRMLSEGEPTHIIDLEDHWREGQGAPPLMDIDTPEDYRKALLHEGIGNPAGVPVTVEIPPCPPDAPSKTEIPLFAVTAGDVMKGVRQLYPDWPTPPCAGGGGIYLVDKNEINGPTPLPPENPLKAGVRLLLDIRQPAG